MELIDISNLLFVSTSLNEVVNECKQFKDNCNLARTIIDTNKIVDFFMKQFDIIDFVVRLHLVQRYI